MRKLSSQFRVVVTVSLTIIFLGFISLSILRLENEVTAPAGWPADIRIYRQSVTGMARVVDEQTGDTILRYMPDSPGVRPESVHRLPDGTWEVLLAKAK